MCSGFLIFPILPLYVGFYIFKQANTVHIGAFTDFMRGLFLN